MRTGFAARAVVLAGLLVLSACRTTPTAEIEAPPPPPPEELAVVPVGENWQAVIRAEDRDRLTRLDSAWETALAAARARGLSGRMAAEGELLEPGAGLPRSALPPGSYRCRVLRLATVRGRGALTAYPPYFCHVGVEGSLLSFTKQTGSERPGGYIWNDSDERQIFLGAMARGNDDVPPPYGDEEARDMAGIVERIGPFHYRIVLPWPASGATLDVIELVPSLPPGIED